MSGLERKLLLLPAFERVTSPVDWDCFEECFGIRVELNESDIFGNQNAFVGTTGMSFVLTNRHGGIIFPEFEPSLAPYSPVESYRSQPYGLYGLEFAAAWLILLREANLLGSIIRHEVSTVSGSTKRAGMISFYRRLFGENTKIWADDEPNPLFFHYQIDFMSLRTDYIAIENLSQDVQAWLTRFSAGFLEQ